VLSSAIVASGIRFHLRLSRDRQLISSFWSMVRRIATVCLAMGVVEGGKILKDLAKSARWSVFCPDEPPLRLPKDSRRFLNLFGTTEDRRL